jgi:hypothetical protein
MSEPPYDLQKLVTVATFTFPWEAQVAQARLAAFGISAFIVGEHAIRMVALSYALGGIQVQVPERDAAAAREVLQHRAQLPEIYLVKTPADSGAAGEPGGTGAAAAALEPDEGWAGAGEGWPRADQEEGEWPRPSDGPERWAGPGGEEGEGEEPEEAGAGAAAGADAASSSGTRAGAERTAGASAPAGATREDGALVTVARFFHPWDAHLARTLLESEGIASCVFEDRVPVFSMLSGAPLALNRLEVHGCDAERAAALLAGARAVAAEDEAQD